ncbi:phage major capsid protein [Francisella philomiragia]|uniref:Phage major capsid protein n=1 Tax=Francisella philomiragia TaxID=28110 RepID=A0ABS1GD54_9GAMM|nr:phage major capsid protein [Francisella philomiragia]MBK2258989.1 phage major capsid protein [Francisella philomiragia]MBK2302680.1 phage major capsid protein [Francisella philomiragia]
MSITVQQLQNLTRAVSFNNSSIDVEKRTVELSFSSDAPYRRWFGNEVLEHNDESINFERLADKAPLLLNHKHDNQIGVVEKAWRDGNKCRALVRFSKKAAAEEIFQDIQDDIMCNVSVGYSVDEIKEDIKNDTIYVTRWTPFEVSIVSVPADNSVGVNRSLDNTNQQEGENMDPVNNQSTEEAIKLERARVSALSTLAKEHSCEQLLEKHIEAGTSENEFRSIVLNTISARNKERLTVMEESSPNVSSAKSGAIGMSDKEVRQFSILRAIDYLSNPNDITRERAAFEIEASNTAIRTLNKDASFVIPADVLQRDFTTTEGAGIIADNLQPNSFVKMLQNRSVVFALARKLTGLVGNIDIPIQTASSDIFWVGENVAVGDGDYDTTNLRLTPKTCGAKLNITRKLLLNSTPSAEMLVRDDLVTKMALAIDRAGLYGTGGVQPTGIANTTGVGAHAITANASFADYVTMETLISQNNADVQAMRYLMNPVSRGAAKSTTKNANGDTMIWEPNATINGYGTGVSNQVNANNIFFGDFSQLIFGMWDGLALTTDPYTGLDKGNIRVVAMQDIDVGVAQPESFVVGTIS